MCKPERRHIIVIVKMYKMCNTQTNFNIKIVLCKNVSKCVALNFAMEVQFEFISTSRRRNRH